MLPRANSDAILSDAILIDNTLYVSEQASVDFRTLEFILGTIEEETQRTLGNTKPVVKATGVSMQDIAKCTVHLADIADFDRFNETYSRYFTSIKPARTPVQSVLEN